MSTATQVKKYQTEKTEIKFGSIMLKQREMAGVTEAGFSKMQIPLVAKSRLRKSRKVKTREFDSSAQNAKEKDGNDLGNSRISFETRVLTPKKNNSSTARKKGKSQQQERKSGGDFLIEKFTPQSNQVA